MNRNRVRQWIRAKNGNTYFFNDEKSPALKAYGRWNERGGFYIVYRAFITPTDGMEIDFNGTRWSILDRLNAHFGRRRSKIVIVDGQLSRDKKRNGQWYIDVELHLYCREKPSEERMGWFERMINGCICEKRPRKKTKGKQERKPVQGINISTGETRTFTSLSEAAEYIGKKGQQGNVMQSIERNGTCCGWKFALILSTPKTEQKQLK